MTELNFTIVFDLSPDQMTALLEQCRTEQRPVQDVCQSAIVNYLAQRKTLDFNTAKALAD